MKYALSAAVVLALAAALPAAQEKPVPKDSERIFVPGCAKGRVFTAGEKREDEVGRSDVPPGTHFRMNGPKKMMDEIKVNEDHRIEITGLILKGQIAPGGMKIGRGVSISPGPVGSRAGSTPNVSQLSIDVEGWRLLDGRCPE